MANENMKNPFRLLLNILHRLLDDKADTEYVDRKIDEVCKDVSLGVSEAVVGQTVQITEVDENGKPTGWEVADLHPSFSLIGSGETDVFVSSDTEFDFRKFHEVVIITRISGWTAPEPNKYTREHAGTIDISYQTSINIAYSIGIPISAGTYEEVERIVRINMSCDKAFYTETLTIDGAVPTTIVGVSNTINDVLRLNKIELYNVGTEYQSCELEVYAR